jgi:hypothetical protein
MKRLGWILTVAVMLAGCGSLTPELSAARARTGGVSARGAVAGGYEPIGQFPKDEGSGVVASRKYPGVYWAHRDSSPFGGRTELYAFKLEDGKLADLTPGVKFRSFDIPHVVNGDWEDIAIDSEGHLFLADMGNNLHTRRDLKLLELNEPDPFKDETAVLRAVHPFSYPDRAPEGGTFNAESLLVVEDLPYVLTKTEKPAFYRFPALHPGQPTILERVSDLGLPAEGLGGKPTGADMSADGARLAVTTDGGRVFVYDRPATPARGAELVKDLSSRAPRWSARYNTTGEWEQVEGVAFPRGSHDLLLLSESKRLFYFSTGFYGDK